MDDAFPDSATIRTAVALAVRAPSIHNSQPWRWLVGDRSVHLYVDPTVQMHRADPDGRDLILSCGATLHHFRIAIAALGWRASVHRFPNPAQPEHVASIELSRNPATEQDVILAAAIPRRRTDRRYYSSWPVPLGRVAQLAASAADEGVVLHRAEAITQLDRAITAAAAWHATDPEYQTELSLWSGRHGSADGVPAANTPAHDRAHTNSPRAFAAPQLAQNRGISPENEAAELLILGTASDDATSRLRAGEAMSAVLLTATSLGLATCPLSEPLEIDDTRDAVRVKVLGDSGFPQMIVRVGWSSVNADPLPATPRHPVAEILDTFDDLASHTMHREQAVQ